jgi:ABC-type hemin transport system ATPase subunit
MGYLAALTRQGKSVLVITHDERLVLEFADRIVYLKDGRIVADGGYTPKAVRTGIRTEARYSCSHRTRRERDRA